MENDITNPNEISPLQQKNNEINNLSQSLEALKRSEEVSVLFDPAAVKQRSEEIGTMLGQVRSSPRRIDSLTDFAQGEGSGALGLVDKPIRSVTWLQSLRAGLATNFTGTAFSNTGRFFSGLFAKGQTRIVDPNTGEFTTKVNTDQWIKANQDELKRTPGGVAILNANLNGAYIGIDDAGQFLTLTGFDSFIGETQSIARQGNFATQLTSQVLDPALLISGAAVAQGVRLLNTIKILEQTGFAAETAFKTVGRARSIARLRTAKAYQTLGGTIGRSIEDGLAISFAAEVGERTIGEDRFARTFEDSIVDLSFNFAVDTVFAALLFGGGRAISRSIQSAREAQARRPSVVDASDIPRNSRKVKNEVREYVQRDLLENGHVYEAADSESIQVPPSPTLTEASSVITTEPSVINIRNLNEEARGLAAQVEELQVRSDALRRDSTLPAAEANSQVIDLQARIERIKNRIREVDNIKQEFNSSVQADNGFIRGASKARGSLVKASEPNLGAGTETSGTFASQMSKISGDADTLLRRNLSNNASTLEAFNRLANGQKVNITDINASAESLLENVIPSNTIDFGIIKKQGEPLIDGEGDISVDSNINSISDPEFKAKTPLEDIIIGLNNFGVLGEGTVEPPGLIARTRRAEGFNPRAFSIDNKNDVVVQRRLAARRKSAELQVKTEIIKGIRDAEILESKGITDRSEATIAERNEAIKNITEDQIEDFFIADNFAGNGIITGSASALATGFRYATSENRITGAFTSIVIDSPFNLKIATNQADPPRGFSGNVQSYQRRAAIILDRTETDIINNFREFQLKRGERTISETPILMTAAHRNDLKNFKSAIERARLESIRPEVQLERGLTDERLLTIASEEMGTQLPQEVLPALRRAYDALVDANIVTLMDGPLVDRVIALKDQVTSLKISNDVPIEFLFQFLIQIGKRDFRGGPSLSPLKRDPKTDFARNTALIMKALRVTDKAEATILEAEIIEAFRTGNEGQLKAVLLDIWNNKNGGRLRADEARSALNFRGDTTKGSSREDPRKFLRFDPTDAMRTRKLDMERGDLIERLVDMALVIETSNKRRDIPIGKRTTAGKVIQSYVKLTEPGAVVDSAALAQAARDSIDSISDYGSERAISFVPLKEKGRARKIKRLQKDAEDMRKIAKNQLGLGGDVSPNDSKLSLLGSILADLSRTNVLPRVIWSMLSDTSSLNSKAIAAGISEHLPRAYVISMINDLNRIPKEQRAGVLQDMNAFGILSARAFSQQSDLGFAELQSDVGDRFVDVAFDKAKAATSGPLSKIGFFFSGGRYVDNSMRQAAAIIGHRELTDPVKGAIPRLVKILRAAEKGEELISTARRLGLSKNFDTDQFLLSNLTREDIFIINESIEAGRFISETGENPKTNLIEIRFLSVVDPKAALKKQVRQRLAQKRLGETLDKYIEFRSLSLPTNIDRIGLASGNNQGFAQRQLTSFISAGLAAARANFIGTANAAESIRYMHAVMAVGTALAVSYMRALATGRDERWREEFEKNPATMISEAVAFSGIAGIVGDKGLPVVTASLTGIFTGDFGPAARQADFATSFPARTYIQRGFSALSGTSDALRGNGVSDAEVRAMRSIYSFSLLDSTLSDFVLFGADTAGFQDTTAGDLTDSLFKDIRNRGGFFRSLIDDDS